MIIFDYDGTIHETLRIYEPAVKEALAWLRASKGLEVELPGRERVRSWLGMTTAQMWEDLLPGADPKLTQRAGALVGERMAFYLERGEARWYKGCQQMLGALREKGLELAVLSNCGPGYARAHWEAFQMERWFGAFWPAENWKGLSKGEILRELSKDLKIALVIRDRSYDQKAAVTLGVPFIGCTYGYGGEGELSGSTCLVSSPEEIVEAVGKLGL